MLRFDRASRLVLALGLFGLLPLMSGCGEEPVESSPKKIEESQKDESAARKNAYGGNAGVPVGKKAMEKASTATKQ